MVLPEFRREALSLMRSGARTPKQLAAELGCSEQTLCAWRRQDEGRQALMRGALARVLAEPALSQGTREMASRSSAAA